MFKDIIDQRRITLVMWHLEYYGDTDHTWGYKWEFAD